MRLLAPLTARAHALRAALGLCTVLCTVLCTALALSSACTPQPATEARTEQAPSPSTAPAPTSQAAPTNSLATPSELPEIEGVHYLEVLTGGAEAGDTLPMIVAIHGLGDSPEGFASLLANFDQPARVILPRGLDPQPPGWSWFPLRARDPDVDTLAEGIAAATDTLAPAIAALAELRPTRGRPIVTGFSQGGMLAFTMAVRHGDLISAAFPVGGWLAPPLMPGPDVDPSTLPPIHAFHGDADKAVQYAPTLEAVEALRAAGIEVELSTYEGVGHAIPAPMHADLSAALRAQVRLLAQANPETN